MENNEFIGEKNYYYKNILYGRTNILIIKQIYVMNFVCCSELDNSNNNQKWISCKEEYKYFHSSHFWGDFISQGSFNDNDNNNLTECTKSNSKFYIDENRKRICFKNNKNCPSDYPYLKENTYQCIKNSEFFSDNSSTNIELIDSEISFSSFLNNPSKSLIITKFLKTMKNYIIKFIIRL